MTQGEEKRQILKALKSRSTPEDFSQLPPTHAYIGRTKTYKVFKKRCELLGEDGELEEGRTQIRIVSIHAVFTELLQGLSVLLLVLYMG